MASTELTSGETDSRCSNGWMPGFWLEDADGTWHVRQQGHHRLLRSFRQWGGAYGQFERWGDTQPMAMPKGLAPTPIWASTVLVAVLIGVTVLLPAVLTYAVVPLGVMAMPKG